LARLYLPLVGTADYKLKGSLSPKNKRVKIKKRFKSSNSWL
jgi:hypothetical protein